MATPPHSSEKISIDDLEPISGGEAVIGGTLGDRDDLHSFDEEDPIELGDGECIL